MKRVLQISPFVAFSITAFAAFFQMAEWVFLPFLFSFFGSMLTIPSIANESLRRGYQVVTFLIVVLVVVLLTPRIIRPAPDSRTAIAEQFVNNAIKLPLTVFRIDVGRYPTTGEGLGALLHCPSGLESKWKHPYLETSSEKLPLDPWKHPYRYSSPGIHNPSAYDIWSLGPDGVESDDDIANW